MGVRNYLIEGVSGAGKTTVATELQRRGYQVIHGDRELAYRGDPQTGLPALPETGEPTAAWLSKHWIWDAAKVQAHVADQTEPVTLDSEQVRLSLRHAWSVKTRPASRADHPLRTEHQRS